MSRLKYEMRHRETKPSQVGFFKKIPIERFLAATAAANDDEVSQ